MESSTLDEIAEEPMENDSEQLELSQKANEGKSPEEDQTAEHRATSSDTAATEGRQDAGPTRECGEPRHRSAIRLFVRHDARATNEEFSSAQDFLDKVTRDKVKPLEAPLRASSDIILPLIDMGCTGGPSARRMSANEVIVKKPHALAEKLGCQAICVKTALAMVASGNETEFSKVSIPCLQGNLSELQARFTAKLSVVDIRAAGDEKLVRNGCDVEGHSLLCLAVHGGCAKCCDYLLSCGCDVDFPDADGNTPLHYACLLGEHSIIKVLLKAGADYSKKNCLGSTPLHLSVASGSDKAVQTFLKEAKGEMLDVDAMTSHGYSPLALAVYADHASIVSTLLKAKASTVQASTAVHGYSAVHYSLHTMSKKALKGMLDIAGCANAKTAAGLTALHLACATGNINHAELLLKKGAKADAKDNLGCTPFHWAALCGQMPILAFLLDWKKGSLRLGAALKDANGTGIVCYAALQGHLAVTRFLLSRGFSAEESDNCGRLATHYGSVGPAAEKVLKELLNTNPDLVKAVDNEGNNVLHLAAMTGSLSLVQWLVTNYSQLEVNSQTKDLCSCLWLAAANGHSECIEWLAAHGADVHLANRGKLTPLHAASQNGHPAAVEVLLTCGAEANQSDVQGRLPIHLAARNGHLSVLSMLISKVASVDTSCEHGRTALSYAAEHGHTIVCQLLIDNGAAVNQCDSTSEKQSPLDYALHGAHRDCADYLTSAGAFTCGGRFHRAVSALQAVWKFKTLCRQKKIARDHAARVLQRAATDLMLKRDKRKDDKLELLRRQRAARIIQAVWREHAAEKHRYEASYKKLKHMLQMEKRQAFLSLDTASSNRDKLAPSPSALAPSSLTRKRRLTLAPQRVPRLDSEEHTQLVASLTNMSATLPASAIDGVDGKLGARSRAEQSSEKQDSSSTLGSSDRQAPTGRKDKPTPPGVTPKQLTISIKPASSTGHKAEKHAAKALPPVVGKRKGQPVATPSGRSRRSGRQETRPNTLDTIQQLEHSIMHRDAEIQRLREENQRLLAKEKEERIASTRLPTVRVSEATKQRRIVRQPSARPHRAAMAVLQKAKSPDSAINTAMYVNGLAGTEQDYQQRCDDLKVLLQSMEESGNRPGSRTSNRPVLVDSLSPRSQKAEAERMQGLQRALDEAAHLRSETERLSQKVFNRIGQPQS
eukprot:scpid16133/ scgid5548/ Inversin; Inversion of embryo turning homolog; Nephrocystin-2